MPHALFLDMDGTLAESLMTLAPFPGTGEFLAWCDKYRLKMYLVTAAPLAYAKKFLEHNDFEPFIQKIYAAENLPGSKSHPKTYTSILSMENHIAEKSCYVDDSLSRVHAAGAAGLTSIWIRHGEQSENPTPDLQAKNYAELKAIILNWITSK